MAEPLVSLLVLNWNGEKFLRECISSLRATRYPRTEIIVVDNGSTDGSRAILSEQPGVKVVALDRNLGYAKGNNVGFEAVSGRYVVTLNNDLVVEPGWLDQPVDELERDPELGIVACRQMDYFERDRIEVLYHYVGPGLTFEPRGKGEKYPSRPEYCERTYVVGATGGSAIYRTNMLNRIGGFDERFYAYHEDADLCMRAFQNGWKCLYVPSAVVYHMGGASFGRRNAARYYYSERNRIYFLFKHYPIRMILRHLPGIVMHDLRLFRRVAIMERLPWVYIWARVAGLVTMWRYWSDRRATVGAFRSPDVRDGRS